MLGELYQGERPDHRAPIGNLIDLPSDNKTKIVARGKDDVVHPPIYPAIERPAYRPTEREREILSQQRAQEIVVAREMAKGRDPEEYWQALCDAFNARTSQSEELSELGVETALDRSVIQKLRWEMNALIPKLAEARVRKDARLFSDPKLYAERLEKQYEHAQRTAAFAEGDEIAMRSAIDNARIAREQLAALRRLTAGPEAWRLLRKDTVRLGTHSVLEDIKNLPAENVDTDPIQVELLELQEKKSALQSERAKLNFWNILAKADIDEKLSAIRPREAFLLRQASRNSAVSR